MSDAGDGDKRSVSTDALETLGKIIDTKRERRDAIHIAVEPTIAAEYLRAGDHVTVDGYRATSDEKAVGIVDPFLLQVVSPGEGFWLLVYPREIHSLRHVWTHPSFKDAAEVAGEAPKLHAAKSEGQVATSEAWLRNWFKTNDAPSYERGMEVFGAILDGEYRDGTDTHGWNYDDGYITMQGEDAHAQIPAELWDHVAVVLGRHVPATLRSAHFSCNLNDLLDPKQFEKLFNSLDEPDEGCTHCGAYETVCAKYPNCPGNPEWKPESV